MHISNNYKVQIESLYFGWESFISTLEKEFLNILNEMLGHNSQQQPLSSNENGTMPHRNREQLECQWPTIYNT